MTLALIIVAVLVGAALVAAAGGFDRTRVVRRRVVEPPLERTVERPVGRRVVEERRDVEE